MSFSRRRVLIGGALAGVAAGGLLGSGRRMVPAASNSRRIALTNLHASEHLDIEYFRGGYISDAFRRVQEFLRDVRTGEAHAIDPLLLDFLCEVATTAGKEARFSVISGFRSPATRLDPQHVSAQHLSAGDAQHGLHMHGRAIDVRMAGIDCADLAVHAMSLQCGGVGYYRASNFVHLDTGAFRTWKG
jgi:uncharacterized protein YcbK (DUF882 family)